MQVILYTKLNKVKKINFRKKILPSFKSTPTSVGFMTQRNALSGKIINCKTRIMKTRIMKTRTLSLLIVLIGISLGVKAQETWPAGNGFVYFGTPTLNQSETGNYALLQNKGNGRTFLNSPEYIYFKINNATKMLIANNGNIGIGTINPGIWKLAVNGKIRAKEIKVETGWSDFVFYDDYELPTLEEVEMHIAEKGHLKDIPSEKEVEENGILLGEMNSKLLQKIEELTLYTIQQQKEIEAMNVKLNELSK